MKKHSLKKLAATALIFIFLSPACGGGGDDSGDSGMNTDVSTPFSITTNPADGATEVDLGIFITATFGNDMDESTISTSSFTLTGPKGTVDGTVSYDSSTRTATFTPTARLISVADYTAVLTTSIKDTSGNALISDYAWNFKTRDRGWGTAQNIEIEDGGDSDEPRVAVNDKGDAIAIWIKNDAAGMHLLSNSYVSGSGWGTAQAISDSSSIISDPNVAVDNEGNVLAVWRQNDGSRSNIMINYYTTSAGWGSAQIIDNSDENAEEPHLAMSNNGDAMVLWQQNDGTYRHIYGNHFTKGNGWETPQLVENDKFNSTTHPKVAMDIYGNAIAVWQRVLASYQIWTSRYTPDGGWGTPKKISTETMNNSPYPQVSVDGLGNAIALWAAQDSALYNQIWTNCYVFDEDWAGIERPVNSDDPGGASELRLSADANGDAIAVWQQRGDGVYHHIWSNRYVYTGDWGTAQRIEEENKGEGVNPQVVTDSSGNAIATWAQSDGTIYHIQTNRYNAGTGWGTAEYIDGDDRYGAEKPRISMNDDGDAAVVWSQSDGALNKVWVNLYQ